MVVKIEMDFIIIERSIWLELTWIDTSSGSPLTSSSSFHWHSPFLPLNASGKQMARQADRQTQTALLNYADSYAHNAPPLNNSHVNFTDYACVRYICQWPLAFPIHVVPMKWSIDDESELEALLRYLISRMLEWPHVNGFVDVKYGYEWCRNKRSITDRV